VNEGGSVLNKCYLQKSDCLHVEVLKYTSDTCLDIDKNTLVNLWLTQPLMLENISPQITVWALVPELKAIVFPSNLKDTFSTKTFHMIATLGKSKISSILTNTQKDRIYTRKYKFPQPLHYSYESVANVCSCSLSHNTSYIIFNSWHTCTCNSMSEFWWKGWRRNADGRRLPATVTGCLTIALRPSAFLHRTYCPCIQWTWPLLDYWCWHWRAERTIRLLT
jgi:hypothetical protein